MKNVGKMGDEIDFDALKPKERAKLWKSVIKEVKNKDVEEKLKAIAKVVNEPRYLLEGGAVVAFIESYTNKKKMLDYTKAALPFLIEYLETADRVPQSVSPARAAVDALIRLSPTDNLASMANLVALICYTEPVKKPKKGQPVVINTEMEDFLKFHSVKALAAFANDILVPGTSDSDIATKTAFAAIPEFMTSLSTALAHFMGRLEKSEEEPAEGEEPISDEAKVDLVTEGVNILLCIAATIEFSAESMQICLESGTLTHTVALMAKPAFSLASLQVIRRVCSDEAGLQEVGAMDTVTALIDCLTVATESVIAGEADENLRSHVCCVAELQHILTSLASRRGDDALSTETISTIVEKVCSCVQLPHVCATMRDNSIARPVVVVSTLCDTTGILFSALSSVSDEARTAVATAGGCKQLVSLLLASSEICGWVTGEVEEDTKEANAAARARCLELRRSLERALLLIVSTGAEQRSGRRWTSCNRYATVGSLFVTDDGSEDATSSVPIQDLAGALTSEDDDLAGRCLRLVTAMTLGSDDPLGFATAQGFGADEVNSIGAFVSTLAPKVLASRTPVPSPSTEEREDSEAEAAAERGEAAADSATEGEPQTEALEPTTMNDTPPLVDLLLANEEEVFCLSLSLLEVLLKVSSDAVTAFTDNERFLALRPLLFTCGPTVSAPDAEEVGILGYDPRDHSWVPTAGEDTSSTYVLRALVMDVMAIVVGAACTYRTFDGDVPAPAGQPLPACTSPCEEAAICAAKIITDAAVAILHCETNLSVSSNGDGAVYLVPKGSDRVVDASVVDAALGFITNTGSGSVACLNAALEGLAGTTFVDEAEYSPAATASGPLVDLLRGVASSVVLEEGEESKTILGARDWTSATLFDEVFSDGDLKGAFAPGRLLDSPALWPYITLCSGVVGVLQKPAMGSQSTKLAAKTLTFLCKDALFEDYIQPAVYDVCGAVSLALGALPLLISNAGRFGQLNGDEETLDFCTYLTMRGKSREAQWPPIAGGDEAAAPAASNPGELPFAPDGTHADPNHGPYVDGWSKLLQVSTDNLHCHTMALGPLSATVINYFTDLSSSLINCGANANETDGAGVTALMYALALGESSTVSALIAAGADRNALDANGTPTMRYAISTVPKDVLCNVTATHVDAPSSDVCDLHSSAPLLGTLLESGIDVDETDRGGNGIMLFILGMGSLPLCIGGYSLNIRNSAYSPEQEAAERLSLVEMLISAGCNANIGNKNGMVPAHKAAAHGDVDVLHLLISSGAHPNIQDSMGFTPLHYVCAACPEGAIATVNALLASGVDRAMERAVYSDNRQGKSSSDKYTLDLETALSALDVGSDVSDVQKIRLSKEDLLASKTHAGLNALQLCCISHRLPPNDNIDTLVSGQRDERLALLKALMVHTGRTMTPVYANVGDDGMTVAHAATILLEGVSPSVPCNPKSRVGPRYGSVELEFLSILWELEVGVLGACATPVPTRGLVSDWTALHGAISGGNSELFQTLLLKGLSVEEGSYAAFLATVPNLDASVADLVVQECSNSDNYADMLNKSTALALAVRCENATAVAALLKSPKVDVNAVDSSTGATPFSEACDLYGADSPVVAAFSEVMDKVDLLIEDSNGITCIDRATKTRDISLLSLFLAKRENDVIERLIRLPGEGQPSLLEACELETIRLLNKMGVSEPLSPKAGGEGEAEAAESIAANEVTDVEVTGEEEAPTAPVAEEPSAPTAEDEDAAAALEALLAVVLPVLNRKNIIGADSHAHATFATDVSYRAFCEAAHAALKKEEAEAEAVSPFEIEQNEITSAPETAE